MGFSDIRGQERAIRGLRQAFRNDRIPNAFLFSGMDGVGKYLTAQALSRLLNCESPRKEPDPCELCRSCRNISNGNHTDVWTIEAELSTIKIEQIRKMQKSVRFPPREANVRVVIVDHAEKMSIEAANAFLKILEEPPAGNLFLLLTSSLSKLLPTILSRCQRVPFAPLKREPLTDLLVDKYGLDPMQAILAAGISEGSVGKALELSETLLGDERRDFLQMLPKLLDQPKGSALALSLAERVSRSSVAKNLFLNLLRMWYRDLLFLRELDHPKAFLINQDLEKVMRKHADLVTSTWIHQAVRRIEEAEKALQGNAAPQLTFERLFLMLGGVG